MILFDIDRFKRINDTYGHSTGDKVLVDLAKLISENIRQNDYFFRIGGEEFIVLLSQTNLKDGLVVAESLRKLVETKLNTIPNKVITISLGVTSMIENDTIDSLFNRVDNLTYKAKDKGRNLVCFDENILLENTQ